MINYKDILNKIDVSIFKDGGIYITLKPGLDIGNIIKVLIELNSYYTNQSKDMQSNAIIIKNIKDECKVLSDDNESLSQIQSAYEKELNELIQIKKKLDMNVKNAMEQVAIIKREMDNYR